MLSDFKNYKLTTREKPQKHRFKWLAGVAAIGFVYIIWPSAPTIIEQQEIELPDQHAYKEPETTTTEVAPILHQASSHPEHYKVTVAKGDSISRILSKHGLSEDILFRDLSKKERRALNNIAPGQVIEIQKDEDALKSLHINKGRDKQLVLSRGESGRFVLSESILQLDKEYVFASGVIEESLFIAGKKAGIDDATIMNMAELFAWDIDMSNDLRPQDSFRVLYERLSHQGHDKGVGNIIAAEFSNRGRTYRVVRFDEKDGSVGYFTPEGKSVKKAFIRSPVKFSRISSHFNLKRKHPILHKIRAHRGVDYAAPEGTPVKASGDGKINFIGEKGGYGNAIELQHGGRYTTLYAHLSRFAKGVKKGTRVKQGQVIGYVGKTGLATAPHLHYEFRVDGVHRNPVTVALPSASPVAKTSKNEFDTHAKWAMGLLDQMDADRLASND